MKNDTIRKLKLYGIAVLLFMIPVSLTFLMYNYIFNQNQKASSGNRDNTTVEQEDRADYIPLISPVDVYGNLDNIGFTTEKDLGSDFGNFWTSTLKSGSLEFRVEISSKNVNKVQSINATVMNQNFNQSEAKQFLKFVAEVLSLYGRDYRDRINRWIDRNYDSKIAEQQINGVYLRLTAPSVTTRRLLIDSNPNDGI